MVVQAQVQGHWGVRLRTTTRRPVGQGGWARLGSGTRRTRPSTGDTLRPSSLGCLSLWSSANALPAVCLPCPCLSVCVMSVFLCLPGVPACVSTLCLCLCPYLSGCLLSLLPFFLPCVSVCVPVCLAALCSYLSVLPCVPVCLRDCLAPHHPGHNPDSSLVLVVPYRRRRAILVHRRCERQVRLATAVRQHICKEWTNSAKCMVCGSRCVATRMGWQRRCMALNEQRRWRVWSPLRTPCHMPPPSVACFPPLRPQNPLTPLTPSPPAPSLSPATVSHLRGT